MSVLIFCLGNSTLVNTYEIQIVSALAQLGARAKKAAPVLLQRLEASLAKSTQSITEESMTTVYALGEIGPSAVAALPALKKLLKDPRLLKVSNDGRLQVDQAIRKIRPTNSGDE